MVSEPCLLTLRAVSSDQCQGPVKDSVEEIKVLVEEERACGT